MENIHTLPDYVGKFRTSQNNGNGSLGAFNDLPSKTVPDQSLSVQDLLLNYTRGGDIANNNATPYFDPFNAVRSIKSYDLTEIQELKEETAEKIKQKQEELARLRKPRVATQPPPEPTQTE